MNLVALATVCNNELTFWYNFFMSASALTGILIISYNTAKGVYKKGSSRLWMDFIGAFFICFALNMAASACVHNHENTNHENIQQDTSE